LAAETRERGEKEYMGEGKEVSGRGKRKILVVGGVSQLKRVAEEGEKRTEGGFGRKMKGGGRRSNLPRRGKD